MTLTRREVLGGMGIASASSLLWALGCGAPVRAARTAGYERKDVRGWLRSALDLLSDHFADAQAVAVTRRRSAAAIDVLGAGVARGSSDGVIVVGQTRDGRVYERVVSGLSARAVADATETLIADARAQAVHQGGAPSWQARSKELRQRPSVGTRNFGEVEGGDAPGIADAALLGRVEVMLARDQAINSRIVYAAGMIDVDDATVWSLGLDHDLAQRLVRVRRSATRVAWNGTRPVVSEVARGWIGGVDDHELDAAALTAATRAALELMTPSAFPGDGEVRTAVLAPSVAASIADVVARTCLSADWLPRPEHAALRDRLATANQVLRLADDPTVRDAYGAFAFDDQGLAAARRELLAPGRVIGLVSVRGPGGGDAGGNARRAGHLGPIGSSPSHLRLAGGAPVAHDALFAGDGWILEGGGTATLDASSGRLIVPAARARELSGGRTTGRVYADVELVGDVAALIGGVAAASDTTERFALRDERDGRPLWRSIEAPWLRGSGVVRARRSVRA
jgi:predicted Zn-dependent protease